MIPGVPDLVLLELSDAHRLLAVLAAYNESTYHLVLRLKLCCSIYRIINAYGAQL